MRITTKPQSFRQPAGALLLVLLTACSAAWGDSALSGPREVVSLNGTWDFRARYAPVPETKDFFTGWGTLDVPCGWWAAPGKPQEWGSRYASEGDYRRTVTIPETWRDRRVAVWFGAVGTQARVLVNGTEIGVHTNDYVPFEMEIPPRAIKYGQPNELLVEVKDWHIYCADKEWYKRDPRKERPGPYFGPVSFGVYPDHMEPRGIWQPVELRAYPKISIYDVFVKTSVERMELTVQTEVRSDTAQPRTVVLQGIVSDGGMVVKMLPETSVTVQPGATTIVNLSTPWNDVTFWTPETPKLYHLETRLLDKDKLVDSVTTRFGFREFTWKRIPLPDKVTDRRPYPDKKNVSPDDILIYFNGKPIQFRQAVGWARTMTDPEYVQKEYRRYKEFNINFVRTQSAVFPPAWLDVADEMGIFVQMESSVWGSISNYDATNPQLYDNWERQMLAMVRRDRNHPSLAAYSMENEFCRQSMQRMPKERRQKNEFRILEIEAACRKLDDTRPYVYEGDYNMFGWAEVACYHYPGPEANWGATAFPNVCWWVGNQDLREIAAKDISPSAQAFIKAQSDAVDLEDLFWHADRPCTIGERSWFKAPKPDQHGFDFVIGERGSLEERMIRGKALISRFNAEMDRVQKISRVDIFHAPELLGPRRNWDAPVPPVFGEALKQAFSPLIAVPQEYDHHFYAGDTVTRNYSVRNDTYHPQDITFVWRLEPQGHDKITVKREFHLDSGCQKELTFALTIPHVTAALPAKLTIALTTAPGESYSRDADWKLYPRPDLPKELKNVQVLLFDPTGASGDHLARLGLKYENVDLGALQPTSSTVLVLGNGSCSRMSKQDAHTVTQFVEHGGTMLVLQQTEFPKSFGSVPKIHERRWARNEQLTFAFPAQEGHDVFAGFDYDDFTLWRADHIVAEDYFERPKDATLVPLLLAGNHIDPGGLCFSPLVETRWGNGKVVFCQMLVLEKADAEPPATQLLSQMLRYLSDRKVR